MRRGHPVVLCAAALILPTAACSTILGLEGYTFEGVDGSAIAADGVAPPHATDGGAIVDATQGQDARASAAPGDAFAEASIDAAARPADAAASCDVDLATQCYPCAPETTTEIINACTSALCVPFDAARLTLLLPDGALPLLPVVTDGGDDEGQ